jgi:large subunit ribosomal protein L24
MKNKTVQKRKQRKRHYNKPLHQRKKELSAHLSPELKKKHGKRSVTVKKGDKVKIVRGNFKGHEEEIKEVDYKKYVIKVKGATRKKSNGEEVLVPIRASNVVITTLDLSDARRKKGLER